VSEVLKKYQGQNVLVTGHTGFKGSWLSLFLLSLGSNVTGISLDPPTTPNHFDLIGLTRHMNDIRLDIRDRDALAKQIALAKPKILFHLAAKPLVLESYRNPVETFEVNVQGTVNVLEAARASEIESVVVITTDKVYGNDERDRPFSEEDPLGSADPYSTSKAMTELLAESYYKSFFQKEGLGLATARAGNVIGGGDFAENRLVPDCMRALFQNEKILLRNPGSRRPWMHVLDPLQGYLLLGAKLLTNPQKYSTCFNFGPLEDTPMTCQEIAETLMGMHGSGSWERVGVEGPPEKKTLHLASLKAADALQFRPYHTIYTALKDTHEWFQAYHEGSNLFDASMNSLKAVFHEVS